MILLPIIAKHIILRQCNNGGWFDALLIVIDNLVLILTSVILLYT